MIRKKTVKGREYFVVEIHVPGKGKQHVKPRDYGMGSLKNKRDALKLERLALNARDKQPKAARTCVEFSESWIELANEARNWNESSYLTHQTALRAFVREFGTRDLTSIEHDEAMRFALGHRSAVATVRTMFNDAIRWKVATANPFAALGLASVKGRKDIVVPTEEDVQGLADTALKVLSAEVAQEFSALIMWAAYTCMRPGEICAARFSKLEGDMYLVDRQWNTRVGREMAPKHGGKGWIYVPEPAMRAVMSKPRRISDDLLFRTPTGKQFTGVTMNYFWRTVRDAWVAGLPEDHAIAERKAQGDVLAIYELRHTGASHMLNELGLEPWVIAEQMRHKDGGRLVLELYGHPDPLKALDQIRRAWSGEKAPRTDAASGVPMGIHGWKGA